MPVVVMIPNAALEPLVAALDAWIKWLRPGTLSSKIGTLKGTIVPMVQAVYYDREAMIDDHALWETVGEGDKERKQRMVRQDRNDAGNVVREEVVMRDPRAFNQAMRAFMMKEQPVVLPYLLNEDWIKETTTQTVKDQMGLFPIDFGALQYIRGEFAKLQPAQVQPHQQSEG